MKKIHEIIQEEVSDCGICSLACIVKYHGGDIPLEILRINTNTDYNGTNALEIINCAKKYGFNAFGKKIKKLNNLKSPVIVHLKLKNNFFHFVVVYKIKKDYVYMMDPAIGMKKMKTKEFYELFTEIVLYFEPINIIPTFKRDNFIFTKIKKEIINNKNKYINLLLLNLFILVLSTLISLEIKILTTNKNYMLLFLLIIIINEIIIYLKNKKLLNLSIEFNNKLIKYFIHHIFKLPLKYLKLKRKGEIATRFNELNELGLKLVNSCIEIIFNILLCIIILIILLIVSKKITLILFIFTILYIFINMKIYKRLVNDIRYSINLEENYNSNIIEYISNIETIKNINRYSYFKKNIFMNLINKNTVNKSINNKIYKINFINNLVINILMLTILYIIIISKFTLSNSLTIFLLFNFFIENIKILINYIPTYYLLKYIIFKNNDFLSYSDKELLKCNDNYNNLKIRNLTYKLNNNIILTNINLNINKRDKIFVYGPSGVGKSTLMRIINNEINNYSGTILKDNIDIKEYDVSNLITYISQDSTLFDDSIYNNITLNKKVDDYELEKIIKICRLDNVIGNKESKLDSLIINNSNISGGEKNRIVLARSLIHSKEILILDEVLKEVDIKLEIEILKDLLKYYKDKTIIYISHKKVDFLFNKSLSLGKE